MIISMLIINVLLDKVLMSKNTIVDLNVAEWNYIQNEK